MEEYEQDQMETIKYFISSNFTKPAINKKEKVDKEFKWISEVNQLQEIFKNRFLKKVKWDQPYGCSFDVNNLKHLQIKKIMYNGHSDQPYKHAFSQMIRVDEQPTVKETDDQATLSIL